MDDHKERRDAAARGRAPVRRRSRWIVLALVSVVLVATLATVPTWQSADRGGGGDVLLSDLRVEVEHDARCAEVEVTAAADVRQPVSPGAMVRYRIQVDSLDAGRRVMGSTRPTTGATAVSSRGLLISRTVPVPRRLGRITRVRVEVTGQNRLAARVNVPVPRQCL